MAAISFDTHEFIKKLKQAGFTDEQAKVLTETVRPAQGVDLSNQATKMDLLALENKLVKWGVGVAIGQVVVIAVLVKLL